MNEWFRDENLSDPLNIPLDDATVDGVNTGTFVTDVAKGGLPYKAAKYHDYFTSCLPSPQKGPDVLIPVASAGNYAVVGNGKGLGLTNGSQMSTLGFGFRTVSNTYTVGGLLGQNQGVTIDGEANPEQQFLNQVYGVPTEAQLGDDLSNSGLVAIASGNAQAATINQLRMAFQIQKLYERDARRYSLH